MSKVNAKVFAAKKSIDTQDSYLASVEKAMHQTSVVDPGSSQSKAINDFVAPTYKAKDLRQIANHSTIIPQCSSAYGQNIAGFGFEIAYYEDPGTEKPKPEQVAEAGKLEEVLMMMSLDKPLKELLEEVIRDREEVASGYLEVERDGQDLPARVYYVDPEHIEIGKVSDPIEVTVNLYGKEIKTFKRFRLYRQKVSQLSGQQSVYFKEFGDPRRIDNRDGKVVPEGEVLEDRFIANEILQFKVGSGVYGVPRWLGQSTHIEGSRLAEELNYRYFTDGRHVNMAVIVEGGTLTEESFLQIQAYMDGVKGVDNSHKMLLLEMDSVATDGVDLGDGKSQKPTIKLETLNGLTQGDGLFLEYTDTSRQKVQSAFNLPDIYVGRSSDYNFATSKTAVDVTERQVFVPERESLEWIINHKLLAPYGFQHVYAKLNKPSITDQEFQIQFFNAANAAGGVTPDDARKLLEQVFDVELQPFEEDWSKVPLQLMQFVQGIASQAVGKDPEVASNQEIAKQAGNQKMYALLKEVTKALKEREKVEVEY